MTTTLSHNYLEALRQLRIFTNGSYNIYALAGRDNVQKRVAIMSAIQGFKTPQAKAGVNAIRASLYDEAGISGGTYSSQEQRFEAWAHEHGDHLDVGN